MVFAYCEQSSVNTVSVKFFSASKKADSYVRSILDAHYTKLLRSTGPNCESGSHSWVCGGHTFAPFRLDEDVKLDLTRH